MLRRTFASRLVMKGVDLRTVQELMGHKTQAMSLRYAHLSAAHQLDAVQRLNEAPTATTTATEAQPQETAVAGGAEVVELQEERKWAGSELNTRHRDFQSEEGRHARQRRAKDADEISVFRLAACPELHWFGMRTRTNLGQELPCPTAWRCRASCLTSWPG